jgi:cytochrome c-type biogenesis protein
LNVQVEDENMARIAFSVPDIDCQRCAQTIQQQLGRVEGASAVEVDVPRKIVAVEYDPRQTTPEALRNELERSGFPPEEASGNLDTLQQPSTDKTGNLSAKQRPTGWYALLALVVLALALAGYAGYVIYPRFGLPAVEGVTLLELAVAAGVASFFSPCSFPLLITLLARQTQAESRQGKVAGVPIGRGLLFAAALSSGAAVFLILSGLIIALGGEALFEQVTFTSLISRIIRAVVGVLLIVLGLMQVGIIRSRLHIVEHISRPLMWFQARYRRESAMMGFVLFGFAYLLAGFGWTGPILAGLAGHAFITGGFGASLGAFVTAAFVIVVLMFALSLSVATAQEGVVSAIRARVGQVKRWGGWILALVGAWFIVLALFAESFAGIFPVWIKLPILWYAALIWVI